VAWSPLAYSDAFYRAIQGLLIAGIVAFAYKTARHADVSRWGVIWRGFLWCAGIALFAAVSMGQPSCEEGDPLHGTCEQYADDGYTATADQRVGRFWYLFILLYAPVLIAGLGERSR